MSRPGIPFVKGHGTGNDFVILPDPTGALTVTPSIVRALCDRHRGIGADGVLVVARTSDHPDVAEQADLAPWFMDYRNADGSVAQMCGNGARVFVAHLREEGLVSTEGFHIATRGGSRRVTVDDEGAIRVDMGAPTFLERDDIQVWPAEARAGSNPSPATGVLMPNPHAVTWVDDVQAAGPLLAAPMVTPVEAYPEGVNVEFVRVLAQDHLQMRVFERGVGETLELRHRCLCGSSRHPPSRRRGAQWRADPRRCAWWDGWGDLAPRWLGGARWTRPDGRPWRDRSVLVGDACLRPPICSTARPCAVFRD